MPSDYKSFLLAVAVYAAVSACSTPPPITGVPTANASVVASPSSSASVVCTDRVQFTLQTSDVHSLDPSGSKVEVDTPWGTYRYVQGHADNDFPPGDYIATVQKWSDGHTEIVSLVSADARDKNVSRKLLC